MAVAVAVAVSGGVAVPVAVPVAGLTKRFFNQKDFLINVWGYSKKPEETTWRHQKYNVMEKSRQMAVCINSLRTKV